MTNAAHHGVGAARDAWRMPIEARRSPVVTAVAAGLFEHCGVARGAKVIVGVSGGADSTALLIACAALREREHEHGPLVSPIAVHVHHHLRGNEADEDLVHVQGLCAQLQVPLLVEHIRPAELTGNLAANAREMRYHALTRVAKHTEADDVAVAHHADDQFETVLMALCRGTGLEGLSGMAWRRELGDGIALVRPMLNVRRPDVEEFCRMAGVAWREDSSNRDGASARGRLRAEVLPVLDSMWPHAPGRVTAMCDAMREVRSFVNEAVKVNFGDDSRREWDRRTIAPLPRAIIGAGLRRAAIHASPDMIDRLTDRVIAPVIDAIVSDSSHPAQFDWPGGVRVIVTSRSVHLEAAPEQTQ